MGGDHNSRLKEERVWLLERIAAAPDLTLEEIRAELAARGKPVGYGTVVAVLRRRRHQLKKKNRARQRNESGPDVAAARGRLDRRANPTSIRPRLVFIDETGTSTNMARLRGARQTRPPGYRPGAVGALENSDLRRRLAPGRHPPRPLSSIAR